MKKTIEMNHHMDDFECMWNGIEDLYINKTGESLPPSFFFSLASFGSFCYMKMPKIEIKRLIAFGDGRTRQMYEFLAPIVGFSYQHYEYKTFERLMSKARKEIDDGFPVVLGALDMYYLPYFSKLYHQEHIPFHYFLMTGYDDEKEIITMLDCGREEPMTLSYEELRLALDCSYPGLSKPFTLCTVRMDSTKTKEQIARDALKKRSEQFLNPPVGFIGYKGLEKMIKEMPSWLEELGKEDLDKILYQFVQFLGTVPELPNALRGIKEPDLPYYGGFDKMSKVLFMLGTEYKDEAWLEMAKCLDIGKNDVLKIKDIIVDYLTNTNNQLELLPELFSKVKDTLIKMYQYCK